MITVRKAEDRGESRTSWLESYHSFSFGGYYDPENESFRTLRVINDDVIAGGGGFGTHPHRDMEILTYVISGSLAHRDSTGTVAEIKAGELQRMTAGSGITHSEFNASETEPVRLLQIWLYPETHGLKPGYEQKSFSDSKGLKLVAAPDGRDGALKIHQDAELHLAHLGEGEEARHNLKPGRHAWIQVATGEVTVNGRRLAEGDGAAVSDETALELRGEKKAQVLVFDLA